MTTKDTKVKDQTNSQFRQQAKELAEELNGVIGHAVIKYTHGIIEEMHSQLKIRDERIHKLKHAIGLAISCLQRELGELAVYQLVQALEWSEPEISDREPPSGTGASGR